MSELETVARDEAVAAPSSNGHDLLRIEENCEALPGVIALDSARQGGARLPIPDVAAFNRTIIAATQDLACAYKPNFAFFEQLGSEWGSLDVYVHSISFARQEDIVGRFSEGISSSLMPSATSLSISWRTPNG